MRSMAHRWRIRVGRFLIGVAVLAGLALTAYLYLTDPARLRAHALDAIARFELGKIDVGSVSFSIRHGLTIQDLVIRMLDGDDADRPAGQAPPLVHIGQARIACDLRALLLGHIRPERIDINGATLTIACAPTADRDDPLSRSLDFDSAALWHTLRQWTDRLPRIDVLQSDYQLVLLERDTANLVERGRLRATGRHTSSGYALRIERDPAQAAPLASVQWDRQRGELLIDVDWLRLHTLRQLLPHEITAQLDAWNLAGKARLTRLVFRGRDYAGTTDVAVSEAELQLAELHGVVPLEDPTPAPGQFLQFDQAATTLRYAARPAADTGRLTLNLVGRLNEAPVSLDAEIDGAVLARWWRGATEAGTLNLDHVRAASFQVRGLGLPTGATQDRLAEAPRLPGAVRTVLRKYQPHGRIDMRIDVLTPEDAARAGIDRVTGVFQPDGAGCIYHHFPYAFNDAHGRIELRNRRVLFNNLRARHGPARVRMDGHLNHSASWTGFELVFRGQDVALDRELYDALPEQHRQLWQTTRPLGLCDVVATVRRDEGTPETGPREPEIDVSARIRGGSLSLGGGQRLYQADGHLTVADNVVTVRDLYGHMGAAGVRVNGRLWTQDGATASNLRLIVADLPVHEQTDLALATADAGEYVTFTGYADAWGHIEDIPGRPRQEHFAVQIKRGTLQAFDPDQRWTDARGWLIVHNDREVLREFTCAQGDAEFAAAGLVPTGTDATPLTLDLRASGDALQSLFPQFVPTPWQDLVQALGLSGAGDVTVALRPTPHTEAPLQNASISVKAARMQAQPLPLPLSGVDAEIELLPGQFYLKSSAATWGERGKVTATGRGQWDEQQTDITLDVSATNMRFCPELNQSLPAPLARLLERLSPQGSFDADLPRVRLTGGDERSWHLEDSRVVLQGVALHLGLPLADLVATLEGDAHLPADGEIELHAELAIASGKLANRHIANWHGRLDKQAGDRWVRLEDLHGKLCDGEALGSVWIDPATSDYELTVTLKDVSAARLLPSPEDNAEKEDAAEEPREPSGRGRIDGKVYLRGRGENTTSRRGGGNLRLRGASFLKTPVLSSLPEPDGAEQPATPDTVEQADIRFLWEGSLIKMQRIALRSPNLRLVGEGTWNMATDELNLTLWGAHPGDWPLAEFLESAGKDLVQYRVRGTRAAPDVTTETLHKLNETLRQLLTGDED